MTNPIPPSGSPSEPMDLQSKDLTQLKNVVTQAQALVKEANAGQPIDPIKDVGPIHDAFTELLSSLLNHNPKANADGYGPKWINKNIGPLEGQIFDSSGNFQPDKFAQLIGKVVNICVIGNDDLKPFLRANNPKDLQSRLNNGPAVAGDWQAWLSHIAQDL